MQSKDHPPENFGGMDGRLRNVAEEADAPGGSRELHQLRFGDLFRPRFITRGGGS